MSPVRPGPTVTSSASRARVPSGQAKEREEQVRWAAGVDMRNLPVARKGRATGETPATGVPRGFRDDGRKALVTEDGSTS
ncbi:hypothetical protein JCM13580A_07900 [Streptomyces drozdowiczii]